MSEIVKSYYDQNAQQEWNRLSNPYNQIEFKSTLRLIANYFPPDGKVCDIGAGPGRYSIELLKQGYATTLFDLSTKELSLASEKINELGLTAEDYVCGDARDLSRFDADCFDALLVLGPLYHLHEAEDRQKVYRETSRIIKPGGIVLFSYINTWGALKAGVSEYSEVFREMEVVYEYLDEQKLDKYKGFTESYFTVPPVALKEVAESGFEIVSYAGVESFLSGLQTDIFRLYKEDRPVYDNLLKVAPEQCEAPQFREATEHLVIVARRSE